MNHFMRKFYFSINNHLNILFLILICQSCSNNHKNGVKVSHDTSIYSYYWFGGELLAIDFTQDSSRFLINPQCDFIFRTKYDGNSLILYWPPENQCMSEDMFSLEFIETEYPVDGSIFAEFKFNEEKMFDCKYNYKDWVDSINNVRGLYFPESITVKFAKSNSNFK